jgi:hypothetical protein
MSIFTFLELGQRNTRSGGAQWKPEVGACPAVEGAPSLDYKHPTRYNLVTTNGGESSLAGRLRTLMSWSMFTTQHQGSHSEEIYLLSMSDRAAGIALRHGRASGR